MKILDKGPQFAARDLLYWKKLSNVHWLCPPLYQHSSLLTKTTLFQDLDRDILWTERSKKESMNNLTTQMGLEMGKKQSNCLKIFLHLTKVTTWFMWLQLITISLKFLFFSISIIDSFNILSSKVVSASRDSCSIECLQETW